MAATEDFSHGRGSSIVVIWLPLGLEFLESEEKAFLKTHTLNAFDFNSEPTEEWAKQILYDAIPFDNRIQSGGVEISPAAYFASQTPTEAELRKKLASLTVEKVLLNDHSEQKNTRFGSHRRPSEPFVYPAVSIEEKETTSKRIHQFGVSEVDQTVPDPVLLSHNQQLLAYFQGKADPEYEEEMAPAVEQPPLYQQQQLQEGEEREKEEAKVKAERQKINQEMTILPELDHGLDGNPLLADVRQRVMMMNTTTMLSTPSAEGRLDVDDLRRNIPSLVTPSMLTEGDQGVREMNELPSSFYLQPSLLSPPHAKLEEMTTTPTLASKWMKEEWIGDDWWWLVMIGDD